MAGRVADQTMRFLASTRGGVFAVSRGGGGGVPTATVGLGGVGAVGGGNGIASSAAVAATTT